MKKLAKQLFEICTMGRKGVRELPFIPRESEEEEVKGAEGIETVLKHCSKNGFVCHGKTVMKNRKESHCIFP